VKAALVPRTKLWGNRVDGYSIVLECTCGNAVDYPGHPDERVTVACTRCGAMWTVKS
jgi:hypothetical protein